MACGRHLRRAPALRSAVIWSTIRPSRNAPARCRACPEPQRGRLACESRSSSSSGPSQLELDRRAAVPWRREPARLSARTGTSRASSSAHRAARVPIRHRPRRSCAKPRGRIAGSPRRDPSAPRHDRIPVRLAAQPCKVTNGRRAYPRPPRPFCRLPPESDHLHLDARRLERLEFSVGPPPASSGFGRAADTTRATPSAITRSARAAWSSGELHARVTNSVALGPFAGRVERDHLAWRPPPRGALRHATSPSLPPPTDGGLWTRRSALLGTSAALARLTRRLYHPP